MNTETSAMELIEGVYDELCVKFSGVHSDDEMDSVLLRLHAALDQNDRVASIWEDQRTRLNVRKDYPELAEAIDKLVGHERQ